MHSILMGRTNRAVCLAVALAASTTAFAAEGEFHRTLKVSGAVNLQLETGSGSIHVSTGGSDELTVTGHIRSNRWSDGSTESVRKLEENPPIQQSGSDIRIGHIDDPELRRHISISYEVTVPASTQLHSSTGSGDQDIAGIAGPLDVRTGSGSLHLRDIGAAVRAESGSGDIDVTGVKGSVYAHTGSGSIRAKEVAGGFDGQTGSGNLKLEQTSPGSVRAETGSGDLELKNVRGSVQAQSGSGTIRADGDPTGQWRLHTGSGGVALGFPQNASFELKAHTGSGSISVNQPLTVQGSIGKKDVHGKVGGGGVPVDIDTGSGDISID